MANFNDVVNWIFFAADFVGEKSILLFWFVVGWLSDISSHELFSVVLATAVTLGAINWTIWIIRKTRSLFYVPIDGNYSARTSVIIPIYKEKPSILKETIDSILRNDPDEIILIFDSTETDTMKIVTDNYGDNPIVQSHFISKPGKRPALAKGIRMAKGEIIILVDSDTQWVSKNFLSDLLAPFEDPRVGGVGTRQKTRENKTWTHDLIDWLLDIKYTDYVASDSLSGSVLCLSGRTAAYRRSIILPYLDQLENEYFLWHKCIGGDDARLTSLTLKQGYLTVYQDTCVAQSDFNPAISVYLKQKVRWSRNSFRTYIKSVFSFWPWKQRRVYYFMSVYHTLVPGLSLLLSLFLFIYSFYLEIYIFSLAWVSWAFVSRGIKSFSHLRKKPEDIFLLPVVVVFFYILSFIKLYSFFTMTHESWSGSRSSYKIRGGKRVSGREIKLAQEVVSK